MRCRYSACNVHRLNYISIVFLIFSAATNGVAKENAFNPTIALANTLNDGQPKTLWETIVDHETADFISAVDEDRILIGSLSSSGNVGIPKYGEITLYEADTGHKIWSTNRQNLQNGEFTLLTTQPVILLMGSNSKKTIFQAYDPKSGKNRWNLELSSPIRIAVPIDVDLLYSLSPNGGNNENRVLQSINLGNGSVQWKRILPEGLFSSGDSDFLLLEADRLFAGGAEIARIDASSGAIVWRNPALGLSGDVMHAGVSSHGVVAYNSNGTAMLDHETGERLWSSARSGGIIQFVAVLDDQLLRVVSGTGQPSEFEIEALNQNTGKVLWSVPEQSMIASPLVLEDETAVFTTDTEIVGLRAQDGIEAFRTPLSAAFCAKRPSLAESVTQPDLIRYRSGTIHIARAMAGVAAFSISSGEKLWEQGVFRPGDATYSADRLYSVMARDLPMTPQAVSSGASAVSSSGSNQPSPFIHSAQRRYEDTKQRNAAALRKSDLTKGESQAAHQSNAMNAQLMASNIRIDMAMGQMQAAGDLFTAVVGLQDAIKQAMEIATIQGVISRKYIELRSYMALVPSSFQGNYFLYPFKDEARGVTIVELDSGKRFDLRFSPVIQPLEIFGIDTAKFSIHHNGGTLTMVGIGLDSSKFEKQSKWNFVLPKSSLLSYDISSFNFQMESELQKKEKSKISEKQRQNEILEQQTAAQYEVLEVMIVAQLGNIERMTEMLDAGLDPNIEHPNDTCGALVFAIIGGQAEMVRLLIDRGADVNDKCSDGKSALGWAQQQGNQEITQILQTAGAR